MRLHVLLNVSRLCDWLFFPLQFCVSDLRDSYVLPSCGNLNGSPGDAILDVMPAVFQESPVSCHVTALATGSFSLFLSNLRLNLQVHGIEVLVIRYWNS